MISDFFQTLFVKTSVERENMYLRTSVRARNAKKKVTFTKYIMLKEDKQLSPDVRRVTHMRRALCLQRMRIWREQKYSRVREAES